MPPQSLNGIIDPRQFSFAQRGMDFLVANVMDQNGWTAFPAFQLRDQMVQALRHTGRNGALAKGANGVGGLLIKTAFHVWMTMG